MFFSDRIFSCSVLHFIGLHNISNADYPFILIPRFFLPLSVPKNISPHRLHWDKTGKDVPFKNCNFPVLTILRYS